MTYGNEFYLIEVLKSAGVEDRKIRKAIEDLEGFRLYFRKKKNEKERILNIYKNMREGGTTKGEAINRLAEIFEKSSSRIRIIIKEAGEKK